MLKMLDGASWVNFCLHSCTFLTTLESVLGSVVPSITHYDIMERVVT